MEQRLIPRAVPMEGLVAATVLALVLGWGTPVAAATTFAALSRVDLSIDTILNLTNPGGGADELLIEGFVAVDDTDALSIAPADATFSGSAAVNGDPLTMAVGDGFSLLSEASGEASGGGTTEALHYASGELFIENASAVDTFRVTVTIDYRAEVTTTVDDMPAELAVAEAFVEAYEGVNELVFVELMADTDLDGGPVMLADAQAPSFVFDLVPGELTDIVVFADAQGGAASFVVPLPGALLLLASGLLVVAGRRRTRPARR